MTLADDDRRGRERAVDDAARTAVTGAPRTRTLATTDAGARRSAASQVADVGGEQDARRRAPRPTASAVSPTTIGHTAA